MFQAAALPVKLTTRSPPQCQMCRRPSARSPSWPAACGHWDCQTRASTCIARRHLAKRVTLQVVLVCCAVQQAMLGSSDSALGCSLHPGQSHRPVRVQMLGLPLQTADLFSSGYFLPKSGSESLPCWISPSSLAASAMGCLPVADRLDVLLGLSFLWCVSLPACLDPRWLF